MIEVLSLLFGLALLAAYAIGAILMLVGVVALLGSYRE